MKDLGILITYLMFYAFLTHAQYFKSSVDTKNEYSSQ